MVSNGGDYSRKRKHSSATANVHQRLGSRPQFSSRSCGRSSSRANLSTGQRTVGRSRQRNQSRLKHSNLKKDFSLKNSKRENVKLNEETAGTSIIQRIRGYSQTSAGTSPTKLKSTHEISFVEGTVVEVQQTYGFIFVDSSTAALEVLSLTKETKGRMKFELPSSKSAVTARKFKVNDHVTFSVNVFDLTNLRLDGQAKYEITNVILRFSRTDEQIYTSTIVNSRKRKIENEIASSSTECSDAKRSKNSSAKIQIAGKIVTWSCNEETGVNGISKSFFTWGFCEKYYSDFPFFFVGHLSSLEINPLLGASRNIFSRPFPAFLFKVPTFKSHFFQNT